LAIAADTKPNLTIVLFITPPRLINDIYDSGQRVSPTSCKNAKD
jgi:hypothetical protein